MSEEGITAALAWATALSSREPYSAPVRLRGDFTVRVAMGDPQAPFERVLTVLAENGLLGDDGTLASHAQLVVMGDYFDWGKPEEHARAATDGLRLLAWLAAHPAEQVLMLAGNHDLARVGELAKISDDAFYEAREEATDAYTHGRPRRAERVFREAYGVPSWELVARDFSAFREVQRAWVAALLRAGRLRIAYVHERSGLLLTHAGVTEHELDALSLAGADRSDVVAIGEALERRFARAVRAWREPEAFAVEGLHRPGDAQSEGDGMFFHRLAAGAPLSKSGAATRRRANVREVPAGVTQAIGHIRDKKSRALLGLDGGAARDGVLRALTVRRDGSFDYEVGCAERAIAEGEGRVWMADGGMSHADPSAYALLDLDALGPYARGAPRE